MYIPHFRYCAQFKLFILLKKRNLVMTEQERVEALRELESRNIFLKSEIEQNLQYYPELAHYIYGNQPLSDSLKSTGERLKAYMEEVAMNDNEIFELKLLDPNKPIVKRDYKHEIKQIKKYWWLFLIVLAGMVIKEWLKKKINMRMINMFNFALSNFVMTQWTHPSI